MQGAASLFVFDQPLPYDEYVKWIYNHATRYRPPRDADAAKLERTVQMLLSSAQQRLSEGSADMAYYYAVIALQFFDAQLTGVDVRRLVPHASELMARALSFAETVKDKPLRELHARLLAHIQAREPERQQMVARQLARDDANANMRDVATLLNDKQSAHDMRRQQLLQREAQHVAALASQLSAASALTPQPFIVATQQQLPPQPSAQPPAAATPPPTPARQKAAMRRYEAWAFATAPAMTAARRGIVNLGNTCYMNSVLQMLNCTPLADYFAQGEHRHAGVYSPTNAAQQSAPPPRNGDVAQAMQLASCFARLVCDLRERGASYAASASAFKRAFGAVYAHFDNYAQQDANEFLRLLLDVLHTALNPLQERSSSATRQHTTTALPASADIDNVHGSDEAIAARYWQQYVTHNMSVVVDLCAYQERSEVRCPQCGQSSRSFAPSFALELAIAHDTAAASSRVSLEDCLDAYCRLEVLEHDSRYLCPGCKQRVRATKQMLFYTAPDLLFVTLKRFKMLGDFTNAAKNNAAVYLPGNLDLSPYMCTAPATPTAYALVALVNHQGNMYGGHYTADCRGSDGAWAHFSDEAVSRATQPQLELAYILCYRRIQAA